MTHAAELRFMRKTFSSCKLQTLILDPDKSFDSRMDMGIRKLIGRTRDYEQTLTAAFSMLKPHTLFHMTDQFQCSYQFLQLEEQPHTVLWIGPYFAQEVTREDLLFAVEHFRIPSQWIPQMERFFSEIPIILENSSVHAMIYNFCTLIWGDDFSSVDINRELSGTFTPISFPEESPQPEDVMRQMKIIEKRYRYENDLLAAVMEGHTRKGSMMLGQLSSLSLEQRTPDALRNAKNYCIIMNSLLRKAAEFGGVHPIYLHQTSSDYALRIERLSNTGAVSELMNSMYYAYCRLVNRHATGNYSLPVQRVIAYIDTDLTADLSLRALAEAQNLSPAYLSTLFKKETGHTVTEFVNTRRVRHALRLLNSSHLQIQTIARLCGIPDVNYFSKVFKKVVGSSPMEYRKTLSAE